MNMAQRIKQARIQKGYNQEYVAQILGVSRQAVSKWETGQTQPDTKNLIALSELLDTSVDHLIGSPASASAACNKKSKYLRNASLILLLCALAFGAFGLFSGEYSTMLFIPISDSFSIGVPLIWYGISATAIWTKSAETLSLILSILIQTISWAINGKKQTLD